MLPRRLPLALALAHPLRRSLLASPRLNTRACIRTRTRTLSTTAPRLSGGDHADEGEEEEESQYDEPGGWLWGIPPGEKYEKEGWENLFFYGFYGSIGVAGVAYCFKPDTTIQTWALEEARRRLEKEGILEDPDDKKVP